MFGLDDDRLMRLLYLVTLLAFMVVWIGFRRRRRQTRLRHLAIWAIVVVALVALYAYRAPFMRLVEPVLAELDPSRVVEVTGPSGERELVVHRGDDGHFRVDAEANGIPVRFLVDTGASSTVLTLADAERAGIDTDALQFNEPDGPPTALPATLPPHCERSQSGRSVSPPCASASCRGALSTRASSA